MPLGTLVTTSETPQSGGVSTNTGTAFICAPANYGPETPQLVKSLNEVNALYGPVGRETGYTQLYDACNAFFSNEGARAYINKAGEGEGAPAAAKLELEAGATAKTLVVTAKYKGTYGNKLKIEVIENVAKTKAKLVILNANAEIVEESPEETEAKGIFEWGKTHKNYIEITEGSSYAAGKGSVLKVLAAKVLSGGANPETKEKGTIKALEGFQKTLGPGQILCPGNSETTTLAESEAVHKVMGEQALKNNRFALCDLFAAETVGTSATTLVTNKGTNAASLAGYMSFFSTGVETTGTATTPTVTRKLAASGVIAGLFATVSREGNNNKAPAGRNFSLAPFVTGLVNTYTEPNMEKLNNEGINNIAERFGVFCLYGDRTALSSESDPIFYQYSAARERMQLASEAEEIGERFLFATLDGRHQKRAQFQGALQGLVKKHWENGALYGETAIEAGLVNVAAPVNTEATEQAGELRAEMLVRISPVAEFVRIQIVSKPITEVV